MAERVLLLSMPQVRRRDVTPGALAALDWLASRGSVADLAPAFPGVTSSAFATLVTGTGPFRHGLVGDFFFDRAARSVAGPPLDDSHLLGDRVWERVRDVRSGARTLLWFAPNSRGARADFSAGFTWSEGLRVEPADMGQELVRRFGPFPAPLGGPAASAPRFETTAWIVRTAGHVLATECPHFAVVRVPHLAHVARRHGPDGREAARALLELDRLLGPFLAALIRSYTIVAATETVVTPVSEPIDVNRLLRSLGMLSLSALAQGGLDVDHDQSAAFALVNHQICHIYVNERESVAELAAAFSGDLSEGIRSVVQGPNRARLGLDHPRAGDLVLVADSDRWFRGDWWHSPDEVPGQRPSPSGLDPSGLGLVSDSVRVQGSLGAPISGDDDIGVVVASQPGLFEKRERLVAQDVANVVLQLMREVAG